VTWSKIFQGNPLDEGVEHAKWRRAVKAAEKKIRELANSGEGEVNKNREAAGRAIEKVYHWERFLDDPKEREVSDELSRRAREAEEEARRKLREWRESELRRLRGEKQAAWNELSDYEKELELIRRGVKPR